MHPLTPISVVRIPHDVFDMAKPPAMLTVRHSSIKRQSAPRQLYDMNTGNMTFTICYLLRCITKKRLVRHFQKVARSPCHANGVMEAKPPAWENGYPTQPQDNNTTCVATYHPVHDSADPRRRHQNYLGHPLRRTPSDFPSIRC